MLRSALPAFAASAFVGLSLSVWRLAYEYSDLAILGLVPLTIVLLVGSWPLNIGPWRARLGVALRQGSPLSNWLTGRIRTACLSTTFTFVAVCLLAWQSLEASAFGFLTMGAVLFVSGCLFSVIERQSLRHFHQLRADSLSIDGHMAGSSPHLRHFRFLHPERSKTAWSYPAGKPSGGRTDRS